MDFVNKLTGQGEKSENTNTASTSEHKQSGGFMDRINAAAGGGPESEKNEDLLDKGMLQPPSILCFLLDPFPLPLSYHPQDLHKLPTPPAHTDRAIFIGVDFVQEHFLGQGPQDNESAIEQAKDEQISDYIRREYKSRTGQEFPIADK